MFFLPIIGALVSAGSAIASGAAAAGSAIASGAAAAGSAIAGGAAAAGSAIASGAAAAGSAIASGAAAAGSAVASGAAAAGSTIASGAAAAGSAVAGAANTAAGLAGTAGSTIAGAVETAGNTALMAGKTVATAAGKTGGAALKNFGTYLDKAAKVSREAAKYVTGDATTAKVTQAGKKAGNFVQKAAQQMGANKTTAKQLGKMANNATQLTGNTNNMYQVAKPFLGGGQPEEEQDCQQNQQQNNPQNSQQNPMPSNPQTTQQSYGGSQQNSQQGYVSKPVQFTPLAPKSGKGWGAQKTQTGMPIINAAPETSKANRQATKEPYVSKPVLFTPLETKNNGAWVTGTDDAAKQDMITKDNVNLILLIDNSYSMYASGALSAMDYMLPDLLHNLSEMADENGVNLKLRLISFSDRAEWLVGKPECGVNVKNVVWQSIKEDNNTATNLAIREANKALKVEYLGAHAVKPVVILVTDGKCNAKDKKDYSLAVAEMKKKLSGKTGKEKVMRVAIGMNDFEASELIEFASVGKLEGQDQPLVFAAKDAGELVGLICMTAESSMYSSIVDGDEDVIELVQEE
ncbi:MAG: VWA domain-containing protein [Phascolarctobacterium sp.]|nr:VWA domain-containing protein [Phascolarctobacterium sp.]